MEYDWAAASAAFQLLGITTDMTSDTGSPDGNGSTADTIRRSLEDEIKKSHLKPGDRLGAERELAEKHGVSRWVIRRALDDLQREGVILRTHGRGGGVFIAPTKVVRDLSGLVGLPAYLRAQGVESATTVMSTGMLPADDALADRLEISPGEVVYRIVRLRLGGGIPLSIESCHFRAELFPGLLDQSLVGSLYDVLETVYGLDRGEAIETLEATPADHDKASALQVTVGSPLLAVARQARTSDGQVFEWSQEYYRGDRVAVSVHTHSASKVERHLL